MKRALLVIMAFTVSGCGVNSTYYPVTSIKRKPKSKADDVEVLSVEPSRSHVMLGQFALGGRATQNHQKLINKARKEAAKLGADFIWIFKTGVEYRNYIAPGVGSFSGQGYGHGTWTASGSYIGPHGGTVALPTLNAMAGIYTDSKPAKGNTDSGVTIAYLDEKTEASGLRIGDQIIGVDGIEYSKDRQKMAKRIFDFKAEPRVEYTVLREGKKLKFRVEQGDYVADTRKASEQGDANAQCHLGMMYLEGNGVPQDYVESIKWFRKGAEQGNAQAQGNLGAMYAQGKGVPKDFVIAHMWYNLAAVNLPLDERQDAVKARAALEQLMTKEQIVQAQRLAREWQPKKEQ